MQKKFVSRNGNPRLILIFAGWGMDWRPFRNLEHPGYDILVVWDYRDLTFNWQPLLAYDEICLLAWSMGVFAASLTIHEIDSRITKRIAVNGTLDPISSRFGIPEATYHGTLNRLSPGSLRKFYRRMCTSAEEFETFWANAPRRSVEELAQELRDIETHTIFHVEQINRWDLAVISRHDAIFPMQNQVNAWRPTTAIQFMEAGHLPDFSLLISHLFIDKDRVRSRFAGSAGTYPSSAVVQTRIADALARRFSRVLAGRPVVGNVLEVGCGSGLFTSRYAPLVAEGSIRLWDIASSASAAADCGEAAVPVRFECVDAEVAIRKVPAESVSVILSASTMQWFNSPESFIRECGRALVDGGLLVFSTFEHGNMQELSQLLGGGLRLPTLAGWQSFLLRNGFELVVSDSTTEVLEFDSPREVIEHLRQTGVNAVSYGREPAVLARRLLESYPRTPDGRCRLTYRPVYLIASKIQGNE